jgi:hypothetical protein
MYIDVIVILTYHLHKPIDLNIIYKQIQITSKNLPLCLHISSTALADLYMGNRTVYKSCTLVFSARSAVENRKQTRKRKMYTVDINSENENFASPASNH